MPGPGRYHGQVARPPLPWRLLVWLGLGGLLLLCGWLWPALPTVFEHTLGQALRPLYRVADIPRQAWAEGQQFFQDFYDAVDENRLLHAEINRLRVQQTQAVSVITENRNLRELLNLTPHVAAQGLVAPVLWQVNTPQRQALLVGVGATAGVQVGQAVLADTGVIGRIWRVGADQASVLLLSDPQTYIPAQLSPSGALGVVQGGTPPRFIPAVPNAQIAAGEHASTSATADLFPAGLPLGTIQPQGVFYVLQPAAQLAERRYVLIDVRPTQGWVVTHAP